jgi:hypothetical protein
VPAVLGFVVQRPSKSATAEKSGGRIRRNLIAGRVQIFDPTPFSPTSLDHRPKHSLPPSPHADAGSSTQRRTQRAFSGVQEMMRSLFLQLAVGNKIESGVFHHLLLNRMS